MSNQEIKEIIIYLDTIKWYMAGGFVSLLSLFSLFVTFIIKSFLTFKREMKAEIDKFFKKAEKEDDKRENKVEGIEDVVNENSKNIGLLRQDMQAEKELRKKDIDGIITVCKERHKWNGYNRRKGPEDQ